MPAVRRRIPAVLVAVLFTLPACARESDSESAVPEAVAPAALPAEEAAPHEMTCAEIGAAVTAYLLGILLNQQQENAATWRAEIRRKIEETE